MDADMPELESGDEHIGSDLSDFDEEEDEVGSMPDFSDEETRTRFTNYSMSSSVIRRNQGLTLVDDKFEQVIFSVFWSFKLYVFISLIP